MSSLRSGGLGDVSWRAAVAILAAGVAVVALIAFSLRRGARAVLSPRLPS
jgi:hypothetical protein